VGEARRMVAGDHWRLTRVGLRGRCAIAAEWHGGTNGMFRQNVGGWGGDVCYRTFEN